ncbi:MAG: DUF1566 domain-containing protein [Candidatus Binatia bacterium]|nr:DUF1566 domain-containing protein [Candidatus Binatia bacterium]
MPQKSLLRFFALSAFSSLAILLCLSVWPGRALSAASDPGAGGLQQFTSAGHALGFEDGGYFTSNGTYALRVRFEGAPDAGAAGEPDEPAGAAMAGALGGAAPALERVSYQGVWPGVDVEYDAPAGAIARSTWTVAPGADPGAIRLRYNRPVELTAAGELQLGFETGVLTESAPIAWQDIDGTRRPVEVAFAALESDLVGFAVGDYRTDLPLVIDPTLVWNTFLGGSGFDGALAIAVDASGNVYVGGYSEATWGSPVRAYSGDGDGFAAKLDASGTLLWNTFLGGSGYDTASAIAMDASGSVYVGGNSHATWGSPERAYSGDGDAFAAKLGDPPSTTDQAVLGKSFWVRDATGGSDPQARQVGFHAKERGSSHTIVGDPAVDGATLEIIANGTNATSQTFNLPASGWRERDGGSRFTYRDPKGTNGAVTKAHIRRSRGGKFSIRAVIDGQKGTVDVVPPDDGTDAYALLTIGGGDRYCVQYGADGRVRNRGAVSFRVDKPTSEGCPVPADPCVADPSLVWSENGDGTATQCSSGLVWEMKTDDGTIHDVDDKYTWSTNSPWDFDGTAKTVFIDGLNDVSGGGAACFAGHCDWRLPTIEELSGRSDSGTATGGIVDLSAGSCGGGSGACTTIPGETVSSFYWSSSTNAGFPSFAWDVYFLNGGVGSVFKDGVIYVRAVRGGP